MALYTEKRKDPTGQELYVSGATPQDVNTAITAASLAPATPIKVPDAPTDDTNYDALIKGGQSAIDFYNKSLTEKEATTETTPDWLKQFLSGSAPSSTADLYKIEYESGGLDTLSQDTLAQQKALKTARGKLSSVSAQLAGINAEAQTVPIRLQKESEGRGITAGGLAPIQTAQLRDIALRALPLQAQAIAAQAEVESAQGDVELAQNTLKLAQDKLNTVFTLRTKDAELQYNHKKDLRDKVYEYLTAKEKTKLDALQKEDDRKFALLKDQINNAQTIAGKAMESGQASLAAQITSLDPKSATYTQDLAALQGQIRPKATAVEIDQATITSVNSQLIKAKGSDGYTDPNLYARLRSSSSLSGADFDNRFGYLVNPLSAARLGLTNAITSQGALSPTDYTKGLNYLLINGATADDQAKFQTDRGFQAWVLGQTE